MLIIAHHNIQDTEKFWSAAQAIPSALPAHIKLHSVIPSVDMKTGTCLWEGPSVEEIQKLVDDNVGDISKTFCYEVNQPFSMGLPQAAMVAANN